MNTELQNQLSASHPSIFREIGGDCTQTCMAFGIECGDGWHFLIDNLCDQIDREVEFTNRLFPNLKFGVIAFQVKEKFGSLRFYVDYIYDINLESDDMEKVRKKMLLIDGMIRMVEALSARTCETCGKHCTQDPENPFPRAQCDDCLDKRRKALDRIAEFDQEIEEANSQNSYFKENHK